jgi:hypothetical protein
MWTRGERGPTGDHGQHGDAGEPGPQGTQGTQGKRGPMGALGRWQLLIYLALVAVFLYGLHQSSQASEEARDAAMATKRQAQITDRANAQRRSENCIRFEREEASAIKQLKATYSYLDDTDPRETPGLRRQIIKGLPATYEEALAKRAPSYCNAPKVGLPEPGPVFPKLRRFNDAGTTTR